MVFLEIFRLFPFPTEKKDKSRRDSWRRLINRFEPAHSTKLQDFLCDFKKDARVCSEHFIDGMPTKENHLPTLKFGYDDKKVQRRAELQSPPSIHGQRRRPVTALSDIVPSTPSTKRRINLKGESSISADVFSCSDDSIDFKSPINVHTSSLEA